MEHGNGKNCQRCAQVLSCPQYLTIDDIPESSLKQQDFIANNVNSGDENTEDTWYNLFVFDIRYHEKPPSEQQKKSVSTFLNLFPLKILDMLLN